MQISFTRIPVFLGVIFFLVLAGAVSASGPIGTAFTYQGRLTDGGAPANAIYDFQFKLFDAASAGAQIGGTLTKDDVTVSNGLFTVNLDFGNVFNGDARFLQIGVRPGASTGAYTTLSPLQSLNPTPYALALFGLRVEQNTTSPNLIGGFKGNGATAGVKGATIGGGGQSGQVNSVTDDFGTVGGGQFNRVGDGLGTTSDKAYAFVGGGHSNVASGIFSALVGGDDSGAAGNYAFVGGGEGNDANGAYNVIAGGQGNNTSGNFAIISGGYFNTVTADTATVGGGKNNTASNIDATVGGGEKNVASGNNATVAGGDDNQATGISATIGGGEHNLASGFAATIPGGESNIASAPDSFAAGSNAQAIHAGSFVWKDAICVCPFASTSANQFLIRAVGGVGIGTNAPQTQLHVVKNINSTSTPSTNVALIENTNTVNGGDVLALKIDYTGNPDGGSNYITFFKGGTDTSLGSIEGNGSGGVVFSGQGNDYAEWLPRADVNETIQPGDIVAVNAGRVTKDTRNGTQWMVVSSSPIVSGNDPGQAERGSHALVAFIGQVEVRVRGVVHAGDVIVPSGLNDGTGIAVSPDAVTTEQIARIVGQAWEDSADTGIKRIRAIVGLPRIDSNVARLSEQNRTLSARVTQLEQRLNAIEEGTTAENPSANWIQSNWLVGGALLALGIVVAGVGVQRKVRR